MVGALFAEKNDDWQERAYFDMDEYHEWKAAKIDDSIAVPRSRKAA